MSLASRSKTNWDACRLQCEEFEHMRAQDWEEKMKVFRSITMGIALAISAPALLLGCDGNDPVAPREMGTLTTALSGISTQGFEYRLRQGLFEISGPANAIVNTEDYLGAFSANLQLQAGSYSVFLQPGWFLERN